MAENAEGLFGKGVFRQAVKMVGRRHRTPADKKAGMDIGPGPVEDLLQFGPISDLLERHCFDRGTGNDKAVKLAIFDVMPCFVKADQMLRWRILRRVPFHHKQG